ncbi:MAG TPA: type 4a pilus biogenesis protein PilO [Gemmatimonadaceae bacterium]|nr:type 4a pilus biogenesis protein PilO [Gemmatimonadaceae bacterium]
MSIRPNVKHSRQKKSGPAALSRLKDAAVGWAVKQGAGKTLTSFGLLAAALGALVYWQYVLPKSAANDGLRAELAGLRKKNAIARIVRETRPQFLDEFRRVVSNYTTARELLPGATEVSNVMAAIQDMARRNGVRVTVFDASKPGTRSAAAPAPAAAAAPSQSAEGGDKAAAAPQIALNERRIPAQIVGSHSAVASFIRDVAQYPRIIYVSDITINALNRQESANLTLVTYDAPSSGILPPLPVELLQQEFGEVQTVRANPK